MIRPILDIVSIGGAVLVLAACSPEEQASGNAVLSAFGLTTSVPPSQSFSSVGMEEDLMRQEPVEPCVILATEFRQWMCSEDGRKILIP